MVVVLWAESCRVQRTSMSISNSAGVGMLARRSFLLMHYHIPLPAGSSISRSVHCLNNQRFTWIGIIRFNSNEHESIENKTLLVKAGLVLRSLKVDGESENPWIWALVNAVTWCQTCADCRLAGELPTERTENSFSTMGDWKYDFVNLLLQRWPIRGYPQWKYRLCQDEVRELMNEFTVSALELRQAVT